MNADVATGRWNQIRGNVQQKWGRLTDSDLDTTQGQIDKLIGLVQERYGFSAAKARRDVTRFLDRYGVPTQGISGDAQGTFARLRSTMNRSPLAFILLVLLVGFVVVGFVIRPFDRR